jgi:toxin ParE1/3/4
MTEAVRRIAADNPAAARRLRDAFSASSHLIGTRPLAGRRQPALVGDSYRIWSVQGFPYILVYRPASRPPRIIRVLHTARDLPPLLADLQD